MVDETEKFIAQWRDTGGSELANTQSFLSGLCRLIGVEPPHGSRADDARNDYVFERRVFQDIRDEHVGAEAPVSRCLKAAAG